MEYDDICRADLRAALAALPDETLRGMTRYAARLADGAGRQPNVPTLVSGACQLECAARFLRHPSDS